MSTWDIVDGKCREVTKSIYIHTNIQVSKNHFILFIIIILLIIFNRHTVWLGPKMCVYFVMDIMLKLL